MVSVSVQVDQRSKVTEDWHKVMFDFSDQLIVLQTSPSTAIIIDMYYNILSLTNMLQYTIAFLFLKESEFMLITADDYFCIFPPTWLSDWKMKTKTCRIVFSM